MRVCGTIAQLKRTVLGLTPARAGSADGFDRPKTSLSEDRFDRRRLARQIYGWLSELPLDWSVRVGLFGGWGEGKTTICNWVGDFATQSDHIVAWYNPWVAKSSTELWMGFATVVLKALDERGIEVAGAKRLRTVLAFKRWQDVPLKLAQFSRLSQAAAGAGFAVIESFLRISPEDIKKIQSKLGDKRVIVIIDDLDRADPELLPQLLLSLREVLDEPGFSFLLPFDREVVVKALTNYNPSWNGEQFLEKIIDFSISLPSATPAQRQTVFEEQLTAHCPFLPLSEAAGLEEILPSNPRKLKGLVRHLASFGSEATRHRPDELDWRAIIYATMIRMESEAFYSAYRQSTFADENPWLRTLMSNEEAEDAEKERVQKLIKAYAPAEEAVRQRLADLCDEWREQSGITELSRIQYQLGLLEEPHAITWAEFDEAFKLWVEEGSRERVSEWAILHAKQRHSSAEKMAEELVSTLLDRYGERLLTASSVFLRSEHEAVIREAQQVLNLASSMLQQGIPGVTARLLTPPLFETLLRHALRWIRFRANPGDASIRQREADLLIELLSSAGTETSAYAAVIEERLPSNHEGVLHQRLLNRLIASVASELRSEAVGRLASPHGLKELFQYGSHTTIKRLLLDPGDELWADGSGPACCILSRAGNDAVIQRNALELLRLVSAEIERGIGIGPETVQAFLAETRIVRLVWRAATAQPLQFRNLEDTRNLREELVRAGAREEALPLPDWLKTTVASLGLEGLV